MTRGEHFEAAVARLATVYKELPNLSAYVRAIANQTGDLDTAFKALYEERGLETAIGAQLDQLGRILNESRGGFGDDDYRTRLQLKIIRIYSEGTADDLIQIFTLLTNPLGVEFNEILPAAFELIAIEPDSIYEDDFIREAILKAKAGGVGFTAYHTSGLPAFAFDGPVDPDLAGFGANQADLDAAYAAWQASIIANGPTHPTTLALEQVYNDLLEVGGHFISSY